MLTVRKKEAYRNEENLQTLSERFYKISERNRVFVLKLALSFLKKNSRGHRIKVKKEEEPSIMMDVENIYKTESASQTRISSTKKKSRKLKWSNSLTKSPISKSSIQTKT